MGQFSLDIHYPPLEQALAAEGARKEEIQET
jgi:hypothetical protein